MRVLVTGGLGFIGSNFVRHALERHPDWKLVNLDLQTYAGNPENLKDVAANPNYRFVKGDVADPKAALRAMRGCRAVVHFAAESHVDRSILDSTDFIRTNVVGTHVLLEAARRLKVERFLHVSTDEVYGSVPQGFSREDDPLRSNSPYAASKAASDLVARSFYATYGLPVVISRCSNNFGPYQYPEKAIPLLLTNALEDRPFPLYGDGQHVRDWLYVLDHVEALDLLLDKGVSGEVYNIGGTKSCANLELVRTVLGLLGKPESLIQRVPDRPGHDRRYALDCSKIRALGWRPKRSFEEALQEAIEWYKTHEAWWGKLKSRPGYRNYYGKQYGSVRKAAGAR